jgi:uncharacterized protein with PIN domain
MRANPFTTESDYSSSGLSDRKAALVREAEERATARAQKIAAQSSPFAAPHQRIELWERLHGLALPRSPAHKLVNVIARQTDLSVRDVQDEQIRRATEASATG